MSAAEKAHKWLAYDSSTDGYDPVDLVSELLEEHEKLVIIAEDLYNACVNEGLREATDSRREFLEKLGAILY